MNNRIEKIIQWKPTPSKGEVYTPNELVCQIINQIPTHFKINKKHKILDPCMGTGTFIVEYLKDLVYNYGYTEKEAFDCIYGIDIRVKYVNKLKRFGFKNVFWKDFFELENMKFDVIIGNPPYQESTKIVKDENNKQGGLWWKIVKKAMNHVTEDGIIAMVVPTSLFSAGGFGTKLHKISELKSKNFTLKKVWNNVDQYFNVGIRISAFIAKKNNSTIVEVVDKNETFNIDYNIPVPFDFNKTNFSIVQKCIDLSHKWSFTEKDNSNENDAVIKINGGRYKIYDKLFVGLNNDTTHSAQTMVIDPNKIEEYKSIFKSELFKFIFKIYGGESGQSSTGILQKLPNLKPTKIWTNDEIYTFFGLTNDEINHIQNYDN